MLENKIAALYLRVSTLDQTTLNQRLELEKYCKNNSITIYKVYEEEGVSGAKTTRPQLDLMLQDLRKGLFNVVVVWDFSRLGRSTAHLLQVLEELQNKKVDLIATSQQIDTSTPAGKFFFVILAGFAEMERSMITERIKLGLRRRKAQGKPIGRQKGARDKSRRKRLGYFQRYGGDKQTTPQKKQPIQSSKSNTNME